MYDSSCLGTHPKASYRSTHVKLARRIYSRDASFSKATVQETLATGIPTHLRPCMYAYQALRPHRVSKSEKHTCNAWELYIGSPG